MITKEIFKNAYYYIGAGFDFEPIFRFSNLCDHFIYVTSHVERNEVSKELKKLIFSEYFKLIKIKQIIDFEESTHFELNINYLEELEDVLSELGIGERMDYEDIFGNEIEYQKWMFEVDIMRNNKKIKLWYIGGEGLRILVLLSQKGRYMPKILSTIQTGCLEYVNSLNTRILNKLGNVPKIWVRGFEATPYLHKYYTQSKIFNTDKLYSEVGMDFIFNWIVSTAYHKSNININNSKRYCKAYITKEFKDDIENILFKEYASNQIINEDIIQIIESDIIKSNDLLVVTNKVYEKIKLKHDLKNIHIWEEAIPRFVKNRDVMKDSLLYLEKIDKTKSYQNIFFIPFGFEDQSYLIDEFLEKKYNSKMNLLVYRPLDLIDLRKTKII